MLAVLVVAPSFPWGRRHPIWMAGFGLVFGVLGGNELSSLVFAAGLFGICWCAHFVLVAGAGLVHLHLFWWAWLLMPWWAPSSSASLGGGAANYSVWIWQSWPLLLGVGEGQSLQLTEPMYGTWGSHSPVPSGVPWIVLGILALLGAVLYFSSARTSSTDANNP